jgi:hypothetical protein
MGAYVDFPEDQDGYAPAAAPPAGLAQEPSVVPADCEHGLSMERVGHPTGLAGQSRGVTVAEDMNDPGVATQPIGQASNRRSGIVSDGKRAPRPPLLDPSGQPAHCGRRLSMTVAAPEASW